MYCRIAHLCDAFMMETQKSRYKIAAFINYYEMGTTPTVGLGAVVNIEP